MHDFARLPPSVNPIKCGVGKRGVSSSFASNTWPTVQPKLAPLPYPCSPGEALRHLPDRLCPAPVSPADTHTRLTLLGALSRVPESGFLTASISFLLSVLFSSSGD